MVDGGKHLGRQKEKERKASANDMGCKDLLVVCFRLSNLGFASTVDKSAHWIISACPTDVQMGSIPRFNETNEVCTLVLKAQKMRSQSHTGHGKNIYKSFI